MERETRCPQPADEGGEHPSSAWAIQQPLSMSAPADKMGTPSWKKLPSWYMVAKGDQAIPPPDIERLYARRMGARVVEIDSSHIPMISHPDAVFDLIVKAATGVK